VLVAADTELRKDFLPIAKSRSYNTNKEVFKRLQAPVTWRSLILLFKADVVGASIVGAFCYGITIFVSYFLFQARA
jgi:hypothetical protein